MEAPDVSVSHGLSDVRLCDAGFVSSRTACLKGTASRQIQKRRCHSRDLEQSLTPGVVPWYRPQEPNRVGVNWVVEYVVDGTLLDDAAGIHDTDFVH